MIQLKEFEESDAFALHELSMHPFFYKRKLARYLYPDTFLNTIAVIQGYRAADPDIFCIRAIWKDDQLCGYIHAERKTASSCEISYWVGYPYWNQGIATEAVAQMCRCVFHTFMVTVIYARVKEENIASSRVLEKNRFQKTENVSSIIIYKKFK